MSEKIVISASKTSQLNAIERPFVTVDIVIFTVIDEQLNVLLVKRPAADNEPFANCWALPGGFVDIKQDADLASSALRKLAEKTNVSSSYLEQVGAWGSHDRDPRGWSVTHVYFALLDSNKITLQHGGNATDVAWFVIDDNAILQQLAFDHNQLLTAALERLRTKVEYTSLPVYLLADEFTLPALQKMYEVVLNRPLDKSAFRTRILATDLLTPTNKSHHATNRPAQIYKLTNPDVLTYFPRSFKFSEKANKD